MISAELVTAAHRADLKVAARTVNTQHRMAELAGFGTDAIVTDRPDVLRELLAGQGAKLPPACLLPWPAGVPGWAPRPAAP
jgi:glycerophosphoryl diester phosphodiesterase